MPLYGLQAPWVKPKKFFRPKLLRPGVIINSVGGMAAQIGEKPSLARLHERCFGRFGIDIMAALPPSLPHCRFTMRGFNVVRQGSELSMRLKGFRQYAASLDAAEPEPHRIWILKPLGGFNQVGIHMYSMDKSETESESATKEWVLKHVPEGQWVLQEYVMNPMTFQGHKFDLRIWAICTSLDPLRVYLMGSGIPKVSQWKYVKDKSQVKNMCVHVLFPGTAECYYSRDPLVRIIDPYPKSTTDAYWYNSVEPRGKEFWQKVVWTSVERKITELLLNAREGVLHIDHQLKRAGHRYKRIIFLQPDMVFDSRGNAYMVEVNTQGYMIGNLHKQFFELYAARRNFGAQFRRNSDAIPTQF